MARAWDRAFGEFAMVESARDYYGWDLRGQTAAFWLWETGAISWLDDESGTPRRPSELRVRTPGNEAIYGKDSRDYLHSDLNLPSCRVVLAALGVSGDPSRSELVTRLKEIRDADDQESQWTTGELRRETAIIYKALAQSLADVSGRSDRSAEQLRRDFQYRGGLIFSNLGWLPPQAVLAGSPIFGRYKAFAPNLADTERLWTALRLREPSFEDCLDVVRAIARSRPHTRDPTKKRSCSKRCEHLSPVSKPVSSRRIEQNCGNCLCGRARAGCATARLTQREIQCWLQVFETRSRCGNREENLVSFARCLTRCGWKKIDADNAEVVEPDLATEHEDSSEFYRSALQQFQEDLLRNDPQLAKSVKIPWDIMGEFRVCVHPTLSLGVTTRRHGAVISHECKVTAKVDQGERHSIRSEYSGANSRGFRWPSNSISV